jgi:hypothetical protein
MEITFGLLSNSKELDFSVMSNLLRIDHGVACLLPCLHAPCEAFRMRISLFEVLGCLTGSSFFLGSGTVENDLLVFRQGGKS